MSKVCVSFFFLIFYLSKYQDKIYHKSLANEEFIRIPCRFQAAVMSIAMYARDFVTNVF